MNFSVIPAIDLKDGRCVRLRQGDMDQETVFGNDPVAITQRWVDAGAKRLHIVDLNGALEGRPINAGVIAKVVEKFPNLVIQVGGGIRDEATIEAYLEVGVQYVILGTQAVKAPHFVSDVCIAYPGHIMVGLDIKYGKVAVEGWSKISRHDVNDLAKRFEGDGVEAIIYTDIERDGMMSGVNVESTVQLAQSINIPVIASGGVTNLEDIRRLCEVADEGIEGVITGRAIYEGTLDYAEAQKLVNDMQTGSK